MRSSLKDVRVYRGADCGSNHFLLITKMRLKFRMLKHAEKQIIFNTSKLKHTKKNLCINWKYVTGLHLWKELTILK